MYIYANGYRFAGRDDGSDVMLQFLQETPEYDKDSNVVGLEKEVAVSVVMTNRNAIKLALAILQTLGPSPSTEEE